MYTITVGMKNTDDNATQLNKLAYTLLRHFEIMGLYTCTAEVSITNELLLLTTKDIYKDDTYLVIAIIDREINYDTMSIY